MKSGLKIDLDDISAIDSFDTSACHTSITNFSAQLKESWDKAFQFDLSQINQDISSIYFCGMGGSAYPGRILKYLFRDSLKIPLEIVDNYDLPTSVNKKSLIFCASYSGNTEETLSAAKQAISENLNMLGITSGGELAKLYKNNNKPIFIFNPTLNPSNQPRLGQGYMIAAALSIFSKLNLISINDKDINLLFEFLNEKNAELSKESPTNKNQAKFLSNKLKDKLIFFAASGFLEGTVHAIRNPINETGKHFASYFILPELNHHLLEGLAYPDHLKNLITFCLITSNLYSEKNQKRVLLTKEVLEKNKIETIDIKLTGANKFLQTFELIQLSSFLSFYLSLVHGVNPAPVPWVDYFKNNLK